MAKIDTFHEVLLNLPYRKATYPEKRLKNAGDSREYGLVPSGRYEHKSSGPEFSGHGTESLFPSTKTTTYKNQDGIGGFLADIICPN